MKRSGPTILIGVAAIVLGIGLIVFKAQNTDRTNYPPATQGNSLEVSDQRAGRIVTVDSAILEQPGFAIIHEANGTRLGKILGISPLLATGENKTVFITTTTTVNKEYFVALYGDDNGDSAFNERGDDILKNSEGEDLKVKFKAL